MHSGSFRNRIPRMPGRDAIGAKGRGALAAALRELSLDASLRRASVRVVPTARGDSAPRPPEGTPWIWLAAGPIAPRAAAEAALRGAYDCISLRSAGARARLLQRALELA